MPSQKERSPQWRDGKFRNRLERIDGPIWRAFGKFFFGGSKHRRPAAPIPVEPRVAADYAIPAANGLRVTWLGHSTTLLEVEGTRLLFDPVWAERASFVGFAGPKRFFPTPLPLGELPPIDAIVLSHDHYDHLDRAFVELVAARGLRWLAPLGVGDWLRRWGVPAADITELDWWESTTVGATEGTMEIVLTPVQHWSGRRLDDRMETLWGGFAVLSPGFNVYFAGDTGYSPDFADTRARFASRGGFDLALLPIGAYEPRWFMQLQHMNPDEAVLAHRDLGARATLGIHWGTFELTDEPLDQPPRDLAAARAKHGIGEDAFYVLPIGGTRKIAPR